MVENKKEKKIRKHYLGPKRHLSLFGPEVVQMQPLAVLDKVVVGEGRQEGGSSDAVLRVVVVVDELAMMSQL